MPLPLPISAWTAERRAYLALRRQKYEAFWRERVDAERPNPRHLWRSVDTLLGRGRVPPSEPTPTPTPVHGHLSGGSLVRVPDTIGRSVLIL